MCEMVYISHRNIHTETAIVFMNKSNLGSGKRGVKRHPFNNVGQHGTITQCCLNVGPASKIVGQH